MSQVPVEPGVAVDRVRLGSVVAYHLQPSSALRRSVLYFHGGGYRMGTAESFVGYCSRLARELSSHLFVVDYRLAPEHPFPAAFDDALEAYIAVVNKQTSPVLVAGDSAGGGLAAALMLEVSRRGLPRPAAGILLCPWVDMRIRADSYQTCASTDLLWSAEAAGDAADMYLAGHDASDPRVSPALGNWTNQPPLLVQASGAEVLRDDARAIASSAAAAGVLVTYREFDDVPHVWHYGYATDAAAEAAIELIGQFVERVPVEPVPEIPSAIRS
ncbi:alpha/beta hydrolase [Nocardia sp. NPDC050378]|uniref:alpha/beta hydrolase n=1 Tax=Nocardia sp. NPDC050378 TaxID=3155400 RepID=UPI0034096650